MNEQDEKEMREFLTAFEEYVRAVVAGGSNAVVAAREKFIDALREMNT